MNKELDRLIEIHERLREMTRQWGIHKEWNEEDARMLREEACLLNHRRYLRSIPAYRALATEIGLGEEVDDVAVIKRELMSTDDIFKSYDPAWIDRSAWQHMTEWLRKIYSNDIPVDSSEVGTMDEWLKRLKDQEVHVIYSSGTTGNYSFVPRDQLTWHSLITNGVYTVLATLYERVLSLDDYDAALLTFRSSNMGIQLVGMEVAKVVSTAYFLYDMEMPAQAVRIIQRGPKNEEEHALIRQFQDVLVTQKKERYRLVLKRLIASARQGRKVFLFGAPFQLNEICELAAVEGDAHLPEGSLLLFGGGWKTFEGERIDKAELCRRIEASFGVSRENVLEGYSMTEMNAVMLCCSNERFHIPPLLEPMVFDETLTPLAETGGKGIFGFLDPFALSYPGFLITGDQVDLVHGECPCGKRGYALEGGIRRAPGREVKGCGGIMASVRA